MKYWQLHQQPKGLVELTIHRPEALNALNREVIAELSQALDEVKAMPGLRLLLLRGAGGKAFVAGADIREMSALKVAEAREFARAGHAVMLKLETEIKVPVIAFVEGYALGGGLELALACDWIWATPKARLALPEVSLGLIPGFGGTVRLAERVGERKALELTLRGEMIDAQAAQQIGLVQEILNEAEGATSLATKCEVILSRGPLAVQRVKALQVRRRLASERLNQLQQEIEAFAQLFATQDARTGMEGFLQKVQQPNFQGI